MPPENDGSTGPSRLTRDHAPKLKIGFLWPLLLGLSLGTVAAGYLFWSRGQAQHVAETVGDPGLPKPSAEECAIARAAMTAIHTSGGDAGWTASVGWKTMTLRAHSQVVNPSDLPGYSDDEADDARGKVKVDWRTCPGMAAFVRGLHWDPLSSDIDSAQLGLGRPGLSKAHDEAKVYEVFTAPTPGDENADSPRQKRGPWLVTLHPGPGGAWRVTATDDLTGK
jgi:hypothetical protein